MVVYNNFINNDAGNKILTNTDDYDVENNTCNIQCSGLVRIFSRVSSPSLGQLVRRYILLQILLS